MPVDPTPESAAPARDAPLAARLARGLRERFGFERFRPFQEAVCLTVARGSDALVVMPTGAGKSLCYQLPGVVRPGVTLVISPLIALMDDQVGKLCERGLRAERIHSGRPREETRHACRRYLAGDLDFLFVAPERLGVPGFPEMLARRRPSLIAVDEAHCISQWGHDFRPDYRLLGQRLPLLRPAPVLGLTATATPRVQRDIVEQLRLVDPRSFIHGFRRENIAVEVVELRPGLRAAAAERLLAEPARRPALVYAPTRRQAEDLAVRLRPHFPSAAYHAGLPAVHREEVQQGFLAGDLDVIVATIAFGMGIDKPDVRTVVHTALPGSVEGYYQEIGRAGRDGLPSRAVLLHGWSDRKTHEFFLERDYPEPQALQRVFAALGDADVTAGDLARTLRADPDEIERALDKLWIHRGARTAAGGRYRRGDDGWAAPYVEQRRHRFDQLELITRYAQARECRMLRLVRHFGDPDDSGRPCGICDHCAPRSCAVLELRPPSDDERLAMTRVVERLREVNGTSVGRLHRDLFGEDASRQRFERLLAGLTRAGVVELRDDAFDRDGVTIRYRRVFLTPAGRERVALDDAWIEKPSPARGKSRRADVRTRQADGARPAPAGADADDSAPPALLRALREWRRDEARRRGLPAFRIVHDRVLRDLAAARPSDEDDLLRVRGIGPWVLRTFGSRILEVIRTATPDGGD